jgi:hypothetical protein
MTDEEDRASRLNTMEKRIASLEPVPVEIREIWRIDFDLDCWQRVAGSRASA